MKKRLIPLLLALLLLAVPAQADGSDARDDILAAMEVYSWFVISPLDVDEELLSPDGSMCLVLDDSLHHTQIVQRYLDYYFCSEISQSLWAWGNYADIDGLLYGYPYEQCGFARPIDPNISEVDYELTSETDEEKIYTVTVHYLSSGDSDRSEALTFVRENIDGQWVFTQFPFFW